MKKVTLAAIIAGSLIVAGCNRLNDSDSPAGSTTQTGAEQKQMGKAKTVEEHGHDHGPGSDHSHDEKAADHAHAEKSGAPHGGTPVEVGDHGYHLELVPDAVDGKMLAYVLDAHLEREVSVSGGAFELVAKTGTQEHRLTFNPVASAPNATVDKTSVFSATATNLNSLTNFEGVIPKITIDGKTFENVKFSYPKGSRHEH
jgi:hypothetical protein